MSIARDLRAKYAEIVLAAQALIESPDATAEDTARFDTMQTEADALMSRIERVEAAAKRANELSMAREAAAERRGVSRQQAVDEAEDATKINAEAMRLYLMHGRHAAMSVAREEGNEAVARALRVQMAHSVGTGSAGGYTVAREFAGEIDVAAKAYGGMLQAARTINTATGAAMDFPLADDTGEVAVQVSENATMSDGNDVSFGSVVFNAYKFASKPIKVSLELLNDSAFSIDAFLRDALSERFGRGLNAAYTTGTGSSAPTGILTALTSPLAFDDVAIGLDAGTISTDALIEIEHGVDAAYRNKAVWMFNDSTLKALKRLKDGEGRPVFLPGFEAGVAPTLLGYRYIVNNDMPALGTVNGKSIVFGDFSKFVIRNVEGYSLVRLDERYADAGQVAFLGWKRTDSKLATLGRALKAYKGA